MPDPESTEFQSDERIYRSAFWLGVYDPRRLAVFRIAIAAVILYDVLERLRDFHIFYTDRGILPRYATFGASYWPDSLSWFMVAGAPPAVALIWLLGCAALVALMLGYRTRLATVLAWSFIVSVQRRNAHVLDGADLVESALLFWMIWADCGADFSIDVRAGRKRPGPVRSFPVRLIQIQVAAVYFFTALEKSDVGWYGGEALGRILQLKEFARPHAAWVLQFPSLLHVLSVCVPPLEATIAILMLTPWRRTRQLTVAAAWLLHGSIFALMNVGMFSLLMPAAMTIAIPPRAVTGNTKVRSRYSGAVPAALMVLTLCSLVILPYDMNLPTPVARVLFAAGIHQRWPMFGQNPGRFDFQWSAQGERIDGRRIDQLIPTLAPGLLNPARHVTYARWLKLAEALRDPQTCRLFATYLCRRYNSEAAIPMKSIDLFLVARDITAIERGGPSLPRNNKMLHQECIAKSTGTGDAE